MIAKLFLYAVTVLLFVASWWLFQHNAVELSAVAGVLGWASWMCAADLDAVQ